ncbi:MAG: hypothetical protein CM15mP92_1420 [Halieaceae bacterium]|nr:MAG: hypothetical protein CM15mP92_1420 [Halieaceae bacterium]
MRVEQLANRLGRGLTGVADRDLDTLNASSMRGWYLRRTH